MTTSATASATLKSSSRKYMFRANSSVSARLVVDSPLSGLGLRAKNPRASGLQGITPTP